MTRYEPLRNSEHANAGFQRARDYAHAASDRVAPAIIDELAHLIPYMPLGFVADSANPGKYQLVAIQGLDSAVNLYVHPDSLKWLTGYTPACYRAYPFALGVDANADRRVLCFDMLSGLLRAPSGPQDIALFDEKGDPTQAVRDTLEFLNNREAGLKRTNKAVGALSRYDLLEPWPIAIQKDEGKTNVQGLYRVDNKKLSTLTPEVLHELNACGALQVAYAQLFSTPQIKNLQKLAQLHGSMAPPLENGGLDAFFDNEDEDDFTFNFDD